MQPVRPETWERLSNVEINELPRCAHCGHLRITHFAAYGHCKGGMKIKPAAGNLLVASTPWKQCDCQKVVE